MLVVGGRRCYGVSADLEELTQFRSSAVVVPQQALSGAPRPQATSRLATSVGEAASAQSVLIAGHQSAAKPRSVAAAGPLRAALSPEPDPRRRRAVATPILARNRRALATGTGTGTAMDCCNYVPYRHPYCGPSPYYDPHYPADYYPHYPDFYGHCYGSLQPWPGAAHFSGTSTLRANCLHYIRVNQAEGMSHICARFFHHYHKRQ